MPAPSRIVSAHLVVVVLLASALVVPVVATPSPFTTAIALQPRHDAHDDEDSPTSINDALIPASSSRTASSTSSLADSAFSSPPMRMPSSHKSHGSHAAAKLKLNDDEIHWGHDFPPTYLAADLWLTNETAIFGDVFDVTWDPPNERGHGGLMVVHIASLVIAYMGALPVALALRAAHHPSHYLVNGAFLAFAILGWLSGVAYKAATPDRYEGSAHGGFGHALLLVSIGLALLDSLCLVKRTLLLRRESKHKWSTFVLDVFKRKTDDPLRSASANRYETVGLVQYCNDDEHLDSVFAFGDADQEFHQEDSSPLRAGSPTSRYSTASDGTLHDAAGTAGQHKMNNVGAFDPLPRGADPVWQRHVERMSAARGLAIATTWIRRLQVVGAYVVILTGINVYTGMCRASFLPGCAAHYIKGSIFFGYGVLIFARYLGAYADLGWAWNRKPGGRSGPSAEMIECGLIFTYGITNTWMERFGSQAGDPYTVKQVQHISIALMFWFAGLTGMFLESRIFRRLLGAVVYRQGNSALEPPSYAFGFNPLPALTIAVTGLSMAAHHQDYIFQVEIHSLWGILLAGGSAFRFLTYFFLWLRPPVESDLPSRPPTEVLAAFGCAAGGIVFMQSGEEISYAAMRAGYDDVMAFLNVAVALTSSVFCWVLVVMAVKGWAVMRLEQELRKLAESDELRV